MKKRAWKQRCQEAEQKLFDERQRHSDDLAAEHTRNNERVFEKQRYVDMLAQQNHTLQIILDDAIKALRDCEPSVAEEKREEIRRVRVELTERKRLATGGIYEMVKIYLATLNAVQRQSLLR